MKESPHPRKPQCSNCNKILKNQTTNSTPRARRSRSIILFFSHHIPFLLCHSTSTQPDDVQRLVTYVTFSRATRRHTFVSRPSFAFTVPHWALWAAHFPFAPPDQEHDTHLLRLLSFFRDNHCKARSAHFLRTSVEKR